MDQILNENTADVPCFPPGQSRRALSKDEWMMPRWILLRRPRRGRHLLSPSVACRFLLNWGKARKKNYRNGFSVLGTTDLFRLTIAQGIPVGVLKAGSSFSASWTAFSLNTCRGTSRQVGIEGRLHLLVPTINRLKTVSPCTLEKNGISGDVRRRETAEDVKMLTRRSSKVKPAQTGDDWAAEAHSLESIFLSFLITAGVSLAALRGEKRDTGCLVGDGAIADRWRAPHSPPTPHSRNSRHQTLHFFVCRVLPFSPKVPIKEGKSTAEVNLPRRNPPNVRIC